MRLKPPHFWSKSAKSDGPFQAGSELAARLLKPLSCLYLAGHGLARTIRRQNAYRSALPVVCVGGAVAGGSGKTPCVQALAEILTRAQLTSAPVILSRGYGGRLKGPVFVDPQTHRAADVGDEPLMLANKMLANKMLDNNPYHRTSETDGKEPKKAQASPPPLTQTRIIVGRDRAEGAKLAEDSGADLILMDDGLQNPSLHKDVALAVIDGAFGLGNGLVLPAGPLRQSVAELNQTADAFILILPAGGQPLQSLAQPAEMGLSPDKPVFEARMIIDSGNGDNGDRDRDRDRDGDGAVPDPALPYIAFAGLGRPEKFRAMLEAHGIALAGWHAFPDHYPYRAGDIDRLKQEARAKGAELITTQKDFARLNQAQRQGITALPVRLHFAPAELDHLTDFLKSKLQNNAQQDERKKIYA